jgi:hypothetical protein
VLVSKSAKDLERAQATFHRKEAQARDGLTAMAEYQAELVAERKKTERLRALRLAKEEQDRIAAAAKAAATPPAPKPAVKAAVRPAVKTKARARKPK